MYATSHKPDGRGSDAHPKAYNIEKSSIHLGKLIGHGNFGDVFRGIYKVGEYSDQVVAVKTCRLDCDEETKRKFLNEAYVMLRFNHDHIIQLIGVCRNFPAWLVLELAQHGELGLYLQRNKSHLRLGDLLLYARQISNALAYLEAKRFVHRDVAARNVLVAERSHVKLADFGMSRYIGEESAYFKATVGKLPIKWMSPESINYRIYTAASDVWMYGVCIWEILSFGEKPFTGIRNDFLIMQIENGKRLKRPTICPDQLYSLMHRCWNYEPKLRPGFKEIESSIKDVQRNLLLGLIEQDDIFEDTPPPKPPRNQYSYVSSPSYASHHRRVDYPSRNIFQYPSPSCDDDTIDGGNANIALRHPVRHLSRNGNVKYANARDSPGLQRSSLPVAYSRQHVAGQNMVMRRPTQLSGEFKRTPNITRSSSMYGNVFLETAELDESENIEQVLQRQKQQCDEDAKWLQEVESNFKRMSMG